MNRRELIAGLGGAAALSVAVKAQQQALPVVGYLDPGSPETRREQISDFLRGLSEAGFVEGQNVVIERRWAEGQYDRLPTLAADLVRRRVAVIVAATTPGALAAKRATASIPIVFGLGADPVKSPPGPSRHRYGHRSPLDRGGAPGAQKQACWRCHSQIGAVPPIVNVVALSSKAPTIDAKG
jgi:ABC transporter substrate binding protein